MIVAHETHEYTRKEFCRQKITNPFVSLVCFVGSLSPWTEPISRLCVASATALSAGMARQNHGEVRTLNQESEDPEIPVMS